MKYLLDTTIVSYLGHPSKDPRAGKILKKSLAVGQRNVYTSPITVGEIHFGIARNPQLNENKRQNLIKFVSHANLLKLQRETGEIYGRLKAELEKKAADLSDNDLWIASVALTYQAVLVTADQDFKAIDKLTVENWIK